MLGVHVPGFPSWSPCNVQHVGGAASNVGWSKCVVYLCWFKRIEKRLWQYFQQGGWWCPRAVSAFVAVFITKQLASRTTRDSSFARVCTLHVVDRPNFGSLSMELSLHLTP